MEMLAVDEAGLDALDRRILSTVIEKYNGGPVGIDTIAVSISEERETVEDVFEPFLIQLGFLARTSAGPGGDAAGLPPPRADPAGAPRPARPLPRLTR